MNTDAPPFTLKLSGFLVLAAIGGAIYSIRLAMESLPFILVAFIACGIVLALRMYALKKLSSTAEFGALAFLVGGYHVIKTWLPIAESDWRFMLFYYSLAIGAISALDLLSYFRFRKASESAPS